MQRQDECHHKQIWCVVLTLLLLLMLMLTDIVLFFVKGRAQSGNDGMLGFETSPTSRSLGGLSSGLGSVGSGRGHIRSSSSPMPRIRIDSRYTHSQPIFQRPNALCQRPNTKMPMPPGCGLCCITFHFIGSNDHGHLSLFFSFPFFFLFFSMCVFESSLENKRLCFVFASS